MSVDTRWIKAARDITGYRGQAVASFFALGVGVFTVSTMLGAFGIVDREITVNYARTNPASATLDVGDVTPAVLAVARRVPAVAVAEARGVVEARALVGGEWMRMLLFVVDDFAAMQLNTFSRESGAWPPPAGSVLLEREALAVLQVQPDGTVTVRTPHGAPRALPVAGVVHDTTLAPAWQEQTGYGYITRATLAGLGEAPVLDELRVLFVGNPMSTAVVDAQAVELAAALQAQGIRVHSVKVPPPGQHPHQGQLRASLRGFLSFAILALLLAAILVAAVLNAILARQVREIGILKAIGARGAQVGGMYAVQLLALGAVSLAAGLPAGVVAAARVAHRMATTMNFTVTDAAVPAWVYVVVGAAGLLLPLLMSLPALVGASRMTVRDALGGRDTGGAFGARRFDQALTALGGVALPYLLALRNTFRRRGRLAVSLALLAAGGGLFMTALNVGVGWRAMAEHVYTDRHYDAEFLLATPVAEERITQALARVAGVRNVEVWQYAQSAVAHEGRVDVMRTYPDRAHGSFALRGVPPDTRLIDFPVIAGRWLQTDDIDAVVLTPHTLRQLPGALLGDRVLLSLDGRPTTWRLVGVVLELGGNGAYVSRAGYARAAGVSGEAGWGRDIRLVTTALGTAAAENVLRAAERALDDAGIPVERGMPRGRLHAAMVGHVEVPTLMMIAAALLLALIGALGLAAMMTVNVLERTRELGVLRAIGARPVVLLKVIVGEGVFVAALSWILAVLVSLPLTRAIGVLAAQMFGAPLPFTGSVPAAVGWLVAVLVMAAVASAVPAWRASRLVVSRALAWE